MRASPIVGLILVSALAWLPAAPPEHVHEADDHGHPHAIVHRHAEAHDGAHHAGDYDIEGEDHDLPVLTFDVVAVAAAMHVIAAPAQVATVALEPPRLPVVHRPADYVERVIHGPPRATAGLRAPPAASRL